LGIELSEGVGKGSNVYDVIVGLRTFPILENPLVATGGPSEVDDADNEVKGDPGYVDEGSVDREEENWDSGGDKEDDTTLLAEGSMVGGGELKLWAPTLPRRVNKEHSAEKEDARNIVGEGRESWAMAMASDVVINASVKLIPVLIAWGQLAVASQQHHDSSVRNA